MASRRTMDMRVAPLQRTRIEAAAIGYGPNDGVRNHIENFNSGARKRGRPRKTSPAEDDEKKAYSEEADETRQDSGEEREEEAAAEADPGIGKEDKESTITVARFHGASARRQMESSQKTKQSIHVQQTVPYRKKLVVRRALGTTSSSKEGTKRAGKGRSLRSAEPLQNSNHRQGTVKETGKRRRKGKPCRAAEACLSVAAAAAAANL